MTEDRKVQVSTAASAALAIHSHLRASHYSNAFREVVQLLNDLDGVTPEHAQQMVAEPPPLADERYDALLAGAVEWKLNQLNLPMPPWVQERKPLASPWWVYEPLTGDGSVEEATPEELRRRRVFVEERDLISV